MTSELNKLSKIEKFFCLSLAASHNEFIEEFKKLYVELSEDEIWKFSKIEKCESIVGNKLIQVFGKKNIKKHWIVASEENEVKIKLFLNELEIIATELHKLGISLIALKNVGIVHSIFKVPAASPMGDMDLLVDPKDFLKAHNVLTKLNFILGDRSPFTYPNLESAFQSGGTEYYKNLKDGNLLWVELQWRPVSGRWIQENQEPKADYIIKNSISTENSYVKIMNPVDNLIQVCLHTAKHSFVRSPGFRLHTDVDRITRGQNIDWQFFCEQVEKLNIRTASYISLLIPYLYLKSPVPKEVLGRLNHTPLKNRIIFKWIKKVGLFNPDNIKWSKLGYIFFNIFLYDNLNQVINAIFPERKILLKLYPDKSNISTIKLHFLRIKKLIFERSNNT